MSWPVRVGAIPMLADCYQTRAESVQLAQAINAGGTAVLTQVLSGMGGVGKSQLAAAYARSLAGGMDLIVWVNATSREAILGTYAQAAEQLAPGVHGDGEQAASWFRSWLETTDRAWLVVLDDLANPADLRGLWPDRSAGRTLVTTRRTDAALSAHGRRRVEVGLFTPAEAHDYLAAKLDSGPGPATGVNVDQMAEVDQLAADLGYLPLALAQAAAFILDRRELGETCVRYRTRLADRRRALAELFPQDAEADDYQATVAATWSISIEAADQLHPRGMARPLLRVLSMLDPNGIPADLITTDAIATLLSSTLQDPVNTDGATDGATDGGNGKSARRVNALDCQDALHNLARLSLLTISGDRTPAGRSGRVRVHALVQRTTTEHLTPDQLAALVTAAADGLLEIWPKIERDRHLGQVLRTNAAALNTSQPEALWSSEGGHEVLGRLGHSLGQAGLITAVVDYWQQLVRVSRRYLGVDHPDSLSARNALAYWQGEAGDATGAVTALEQVLADQLRVLGPDHPDTLTTRNNLALSRGKAGYPTGAVTALEQLLPDLQRVLGPDNPHTLTARGTRAYLRSEVGDATGAVTALEQVLADQLRVLGPDHPDTLTTRNNLALSRGEAGDPTGAVTALEQLLPDLQRVLGPDNPHTLTARGNLARWRGKAGDPTAAATAFEQLFPDRRRVLGPEHPDTFGIWSSVAHWRIEAGDLTGAAAAYEELLTSRLRVLGPDHPETLTARSLVAHYRGRAGDPTAAATAFEQVLTDRLRVLGADNPVTFNTWANVARWRRDAGDLAGGISALEQLLADQIRVLGPDHPDTFTTRFIRAHWRGKAGDPTTAVTAFEQLLADQIRVLGPEHPEILTTRNNLVYWRDKAGGP